jgi:hypothetical protein
MTVFHYLLFLWIKIVGQQNPEVGHDSYQSSALTLLARHLDIFISLKGLYPLK